jgi:hypothetical protein
VGRICAEVGETWVANKPGGLNVRNSDDLETPAARSLFAGRFGKPTHWRDLGKADEVGEVTGKSTLPGINGSSILGKACRDNVGIAFGKAWKRGNWMAN